MGRIFAFRIDNHKNVLKRNKSTIWDVIDSTWVVILLVFQVIVFKVSRAINSRVKKGQSNTDRERERSNIINILANHDRLINGSFRKEMHAARYYFKENLSITDVGRWKFDILVLIMNLTSILPSIYLLSINYINHFNGGSLLIKNNKQAFQKSHVWRRRRICQLYPSSSLWA